MRDDIAKARLLDDLRYGRNVLAGKVIGLSEYDARRPLTPTGTNLLGLVKHCALWESRYLGQVFDRPFPEAMPPWDDVEAGRDYFWLTADETRAEVLGLYERVAAHGDATIEALPLDAPGHVPWWPSPEVTLLGVISHLLTETARHCGHADILREQLDGAIGDDVSAPARDAAYWQQWCNSIDEAARDADRGCPPVL